MKIFLTGATGGIGSEIKDLLEKQNIEVIYYNSNDLDLSKDFNINHEVDGFIHCAAVNDIKKHYEINFQELEKLFYINTWSFIRLCNQLKFSNGSNIIAIGSLYATCIKEGRMQYSMSKHALLSSVKTLALELSNKNIKVNMISPGFVNTNMTRKNNTKERIDELNKNIPLGMASPEEISNFCLHLIKYNKTMTGQNIEIDGGYKLKTI